jgi:hypothetical protein
VSISFFKKIFFSRCPNIFLRKLKILRSNALRFRDGSCFCDLPVHAAPSLQATVRLLRCVSSGGSLSRFYTPSRCSPPPLHPPPTTEAQLLGRGGIFSLLSLISSLASLSLDKLYGYPLSHNLCPMIFVSLCLNIDQTLWFSRLP